MEFKFSIWAGKMQGRRIGWETPGVALVDVKGIWVSLLKLDMNQQCDAVAKRANSLLGLTGPQESSSWKRVASFYSILVKSNLEFGF